jgi:hypothetical protein
MTGRNIGAVAAILLGGLGCMKTDRWVADQIDSGIDVSVSWDLASPDLPGPDLPGPDLPGPDLPGPDAAPEFGPFSAPIAITTLASPTTDVHGPSLTDDQLELFVACEEQGATTFHIWVSKRTTTTAPWPLAVQVPELFGSVFDVDPEVSPDGLTIYFASNRSGAGFRLYYTTRATRDEQWKTPPKEITELTSSTMDRYGPSVSPDGLFMVFASTSRDATDYRLSSASRTDTGAIWKDIQDLPVNSGLQDSDPAIFMGNHSLIWSSRAPSGGKSWDLVEVSRLDPSMPFQPPSTPLAPLRTDVAERYPWVSQDGRHILFNREPVGSPGVIYEAWRQRIN